MNNLDREEDSKDPSSEGNAKLFDILTRARKVFITGTIEQRMARDVVQHLHALAHISDDPIQVFISSPGGHVESGDLIFDTLRFIKPRVITIGSGWVASAGALIYLAANKEDRYTLPNTRFLLHQPSGESRGPASDLNIYLDEIVKMRDRLNRIFADATGQAVEKIASDTARDFWLSAEEAVQYGLAYKIISSESEIDNRTNNR
ncbi:MULTISPECIES: ATP-dependent Clp protease proteolytic subunit [Burkholderia]|uniref:ATP-dependent Clp protease proteolytic subunit n=1 Tax=Burkholderia lata (strain ATCC 17760 / DSM 23089 / LMG 22485 / NCIMB 9086 / R18194 / 383) TaxID=482957 RepID=Q397T0_BURL3|nr:MULTISPECIES: ATP-dependent Clp protease proteolytic subunit [Burkholderia]ABB11281.1 ATP-dependent Clp protease proteolytic subunit ClpP [Burkholderia lata]VWM19241.1 Clp protease proteolytic subunit ClpP [Burkholderia lata]